MNTDKTENQTIEKSDNELIAEVMSCNDILVVALFDGWVFDPERWIPPNVWIEKNIDGTNRTIQVRRPDKTFVSTFPSLKYDTSWDALMPVVEKIETLDNGYDTRICFHADGGDYFCDIVDEENTERACQVSHKSKIEAVYKAVLEFIKWYSQKVKTDTEV